MSVTITRDPAAVASRHFDLIVVGGGIYGLCATLEAARRGIDVLLLEANDFNSGVSFNSLRILHGGLRYLQSMDLPRFFESVGERRWFMANYPELTGRLGCLMPLYGKGLKRPVSFGPALRLNDFLSRKKNVGVPASNHLRKSRILSKAQTLEVFPGVTTQGLQGAAAWDDGHMRHHQRLFIEMLRWAVAAGASALNYAPVTRVLVSDGRATGVEIEDRVSGKRFEIQARRVLNTAGPRVRAFAAAAGDEVDELFIPSLAFNLLVDHPPLSERALALEPDEPNARTYFLTPWRGTSGGRMLVGTYHMPWTGPVTDQPEVPGDAIDDFLRGLNAAAGPLELSRKHVVRVLAGFLPAQEPGVEYTAHRSVYVDHGKRGGPAGLFSLSGVKYTTARLEAERALRQIFGRELSEYRAQSTRPVLENAFDAYDFVGGDGDFGAARRLVQNEAVVCVDDLIQRRTDWGADPQEAQRIARTLAEVLNLPITVQNGGGVAAGNGR